SRDANNVVDADGNGAQSGRNHRRQAYSATFRSDADFDYRLVRLDGADHPPVHNVFLSGESPFWKQSLRHLNAFDQVGADLGSEGHGLGGYDERFARRLRAGPSAARRHAIEEAGHEEGPCQAAAHDDGESAVEAHSSGAVLRWDGCASE